MAKFEIGDKVSVLDEAINGKVLSVSGREITIETSDGFEISYNDIDLIKTGSARLMTGGPSVSSSGRYAADKQSVDRPASASRRPTSAIPIFDLHIEKLVKSHRHMTNTDILIFQTDTAKNHIEFAIRNRISKIVIIHGVGEGVLKSEIERLLRHYDRATSREASFSVYGQGAMEITFRQNG